MAERFRKKPIVIEAMQLEPGFGAIQRMLDWINAGTGWTPDMGDPPAMYYYGRFTIRTLEGDMDAKEGDWIIKGVQGEFYPCKPDIFEATYEPVEGDAA